LDKSWPHCETAVYVKNGSRLLKIVEITASAISSDPNHDDTQSYTASILARDGSCDLHVNRNSCDQCLLRWFHCCFN